MVLSVSNNSIKVMNAALTELGIEPISAFTDNSIAARTGNTTFADVVEEVLSLYPWRFARDVQTLQADAQATPPAGWESMWPLPDAALVVHSVHADDVRQEFDVFGRNVALNVDPDGAAVVKAEVTIYVDPSLWPGYFRRAFIVHFASTMAMPLTQDESMMERLRMSAARQLAVAKTRDAQGRTPTRIDASLLIRRRRGAS